MRSQYKRGEFICSRINYYLLLDLGKGVINSDQSAYVFNLMVWATKEKKLFSNGVTTDEDLAQNEYYLKAVDDYRNYLMIKREILEAKHG